MYVHVCIIYHNLCMYINVLCTDPMDIFDPPDRETMRLQKFGKLLAGPNTDLGEYSLCQYTHTLIASTQSEHATPYTHYVDMYITCTCSMYTYMYMYALVHVPYIYIYICVCTYWAMLMCLSIVYSVVCCLLAVNH